MQKYVIASAIVLSLVNLSSADVITINNASFESPALTDGGFVAGIPGWTTTGAGSGVFNPTTTQFPGEAPDGENTAFSNDGDDIFQVLGDTLTANYRYELQVDVGDRLDSAFPGYSVQLLAGGVVLAEDVNSLAPSGGFLTSTVIYKALDGDAQLGQTLAIRLNNLGSPTPSNVQVNWDNVRLDAAFIPEPSTLGMMLLAGVGISAFSLRRRLRVQKN